MNFLIKIEEAINQFLEKVFEKFKGVLPPFVFAFLYALKNLPQTLKQKWTKTYQPKMRITMLKFVGYTEHYTTMVRGHFTAVLIYLRSEEFKKADKKQMMLKPLHYARFNPLKALAVLSTAAVVVMVWGVIFSNTAKIVTGTHALRKPASFSTAEEDLFLELKNQPFDMHQAGAAGGHGAEGSDDAGQKIHFDIKIEAKDEKDKALLENKESEIHHALEHLALPVPALPVSPENQKEIELLLAKTINGKFKADGHGEPVRLVLIKQKLGKRPAYYRQAEKMFKIEDMNLQLFLEDTHRNRQVWIDFSMLASNRNAVLFLKEHEVQLKDHIMTNVEPVIPSLPVEEEGRQIIKDKLRLEINEFLKKNEIEGKILEIYIDYLMVS